MKRILLLLTLALSGKGLAQNGYWQQQANYTIAVNMDVKKFQYQGKQQVVYTNNSPDTLRRVFFHLYNNAFQPGSEMDARLQSVADPDGRMVTKTKVDGKEVKNSRIAALKPDEIGYLKVNNFKQDGASAQTKVAGTILDVTLAKPILPGAKTTFDFDFDGQVPVQIRRSGRNNAEGVDLSMAQWYPKMAEYDFEGWHNDPYIGREFHGVWGNFDVKITIDKDYVLGGTGYLQNANEIGHGYQDKGVTVTYPKKTKTLTWHFLAPNVHDFTWAADPKYNHETYDGPNGVKLHFLWLDNQDDPEVSVNWRKLQPITARLMDFYNKTVGEYPYKQYSVIQGGDGGMEYGMCTLILGNGKFDGLVGVTMHELAHSWFQFILASNEGKHAWMDEGFATYLETLGENELADKKVDNPFESSYQTYVKLANSGKEQPLGTHADRYDENRVYSIGAYVKGCLFLSQLEYVIGRDNVRKGLKNYYRDFKFKHPTPNDIKRAMEKVSGAVLDWYLIDWTETTNMVDYAISDVLENTNGTQITLNRIGRMPMPIDLVVEYENGQKEYVYIPLRMMAFEKPNPYPQMKRTVLADWAWAMPKYQFTLPKASGKIKSVTIDPSGYMTDVKPENNTFPAKK